MLPGFLCHLCTQKMEKVDAHSWMCVRCRVNEYWPEHEDEDEISSLLQREWDAANHSLNDDVA